VPLPSKYGGYFTLTKQELYDAIDSWLDESNEVSGRTIDAFLASIGFRIALMGDATRLDCFGGPSRHSRTARKKSRGVGGESLPVRVLLGGR
jgi:hypothetical protein